MASGSQWNGKRSGSWFFFSVPLFISPHSYISLKANYFHSPFILNCSYYERETIPPPAKQKRFRQELLPDRGRDTRRPPALQGQFLLWLRQCDQGSIDWLRRKRNRRSRSGIEHQTECPPGSHGRCIQGPPRRQL